MARIRKKEPSGRTHLAPSSRMSGQGATAKNRQAKPTFQRKIVLPAIALMLLAAIGCFIFLFIRRPSLWSSKVKIDEVQKNAAAVSEVFSNPQLLGIEPQVAKKLSELRRNVQNNPESASAWGKFAMNLHVHDFKQESVACYKQAAVLDRSDFRWPYYCGIALNELGSSETIRMFEYCINLKGDYAPLYVRYGEALLEEGEAEKASTQFKKATDIDPRSAHGYLGLAKVAHMRNNLRASQSYLLRAVEISPNFGEAQNLLAEIYRRLNETANAKRIFKQAGEMAEQTPLSDPLYAELAAQGDSALWFRFRGRALMEKGMHEAAVQEFKNALKIRPDAQAHHNLAVALERSGRLTDAVIHYEEAVRLHPTYLNYFNLGVALGKLARYREAEQALRESIQIDPDRDEAYYNLAVSIEKQGRHQEQIEFLKRTIQLNPEHSNAFFNLGVAYVNLKLWPQAIESFQNAIRINPDDTEALYELGIALGRSGRYEDMIATMRNLAQKKPNDPKVHFHLAWAYAAAGNQNSAMEELKILENLDPTLASQLRRTYNFGR